MIARVSLAASSDTRSVGKSDAHAPDCAASRAQESHHDTVTGPQLWVANDYHRVGHPRILNPNSNLRLVLD
jgi:hypothetical protein